MTLKAEPYSRFLTTSTVLQNDEEVWGTWDKPSFLANVVPQSQRVSIRVNNNRAGRPDLISRDIYGTTKLDWLIIAFNDAFDVFNWPRAGTVITTPSSEIVLGEVL